MTSNLTLGLDSLATLATLFVLGRCLYLSFRSSSLDERGLCQRWGFGYGGSFGDILGVVGQKRSLLGQNVRRRIV